MLKIDARNVHIYMKLMSAAADRQEFKQATRYWLLALQEIRVQRHISIAEKIRAKMKRTAFKIEIDHEFETYQGSTR